MLHQSHQWLGIFVKKQSDTYEQFRDHQQQQLESYIPSFMIVVCEYQCTFPFLDWNELIMYHPTLLNVLASLLSHKMFCGSNGVVHQILDRKSTRLNSSHVAIPRAVFC